MGRRLLVLTLLWVLLVAGMVAVAVLVGYTARECQAPVREIGAAAGAALH